MIRLLSFQLGQLEFMVSLRPTTLLSPRASLCFSYLAFLSHPSPMSGHVLLDFIVLLGIRPPGIMVFSTSIISCSRKHSGNSGISQTEENGSLGHEIVYSIKDEFLEQKLRVEKVMKSEVIKSRVSMVFTKLFG